MQEPTTSLDAAFMHSSLLWLNVTVFAYLGARWLYQRSGANPFLLPIITAVLAVICVLLATGTPYPVYFQSTSILHFLIGPATVALAIPLYSQLAQLRRIWLPLCVALAAGSITAIVSALGIGWLFGGSWETLLSLAPKSATMPIAMPIAQQIGGVASLAAVAVAATGIAGVIMARPLLRLMRITDPQVRGFAVGMSAHAIGTARAIQVSDTAGAFSALAMGLNGILTAVLVPSVLWLLSWLAG